MRVKICGLTRPGDAELAIELGADALGFIFEPSSPRFIEREARGFISQLEPYVFRVAVYGALSEVERYGCSALQFVEGPRDVIHRERPPVFKVMRPRFSDVTVLRWDATEWLHKFQPIFDVQAIVLDAFDDKAFGGTGKKVDWQFAAGFVGISPLPVILAGGLTPDNVAAAIEQVRPYAVDVSSGIESAPGIKDHAKMRDFIQAAKESVG